MKKLIALAVLATSTVSFAAERNIFDIMYLPSAKTAYGISQLEMYSGKVKYDMSGVDDTKFSGPSFVQTLGYSFADNFSLNVSLNYTDLKVKQDETTHSKGVSDPKFQARFRLMDTAQQFDILAGAIIGVGDSKTKSNGDSNNLQGGHSLFLGAQYGAKTESLQWSLLAQVQHDFKATTDDKENDVKIKDDAHNTLNLRGDILNKLAESSYLRSFVGVNFTEGYDDNNDGDTASSTVYSIGTEYQHILSTNLMLRAGLDYNSIHANSGLVDSYNLWIFRLGANYQF